MFFQETTPNSSGYMIAGYAVAFIVMALYALSLYLRARNLKQDLTILEEMDKPAPPAKTSAPQQPKKTQAKSSSKRSGKTVTKKSMQN